MKMTIELDVFSGRPNPAWILENDEADSLLVMLQNLPPAPGPISIDGLGYRGFILSVEKDGGKDTIHVFHGLIWIKGQVKMFADQNHLEKRLLQMAKQRGYGDIL